eukprot:Nitzschia sp. Nitz4//scaffold101_size76361//52346//53543//NITZ4_005608-RA/size76361-snap-gene-0.3-mRNA-1//1//CDS//3329532176//1042//frame0
MVVLLSEQLLQLAKSMVRLLATGTKTEIGRAQAKVVSVFQWKISMVVAQVLVASCMAIVLEVFSVIGTVYNRIKDHTNQLDLGCFFHGKGTSCLCCQESALKDNVTGSLSMLCSDKTGTLTTTAQMSIITEQIYTVEDFSEDDVMMYPYLCSNADKIEDPMLIALAVPPNKLPESWSTPYKQSLLAFNSIVKNIDTEAREEEAHDLQRKAEGINDKVNSMQKINDYVHNLGAADVRQSQLPCVQENGVACMEFCRIPTPHATGRPFSCGYCYRRGFRSMITGEMFDCCTQDAAKPIGLLGTNIQARETIRDAAQQEKKDLIWHVDGFAVVLPSDKRSEMGVLLLE